MRKEVFGVKFAGKSNQNQKVSEIWNICIAVGIIVLSIIALGLILVYYETPAFEMKTGKEGFIQVIKRMKEIESLKQLQDELAIEIEQELSSNVDLEALARQREEARGRLDAILVRTVENKTILKETLNLEKLLHETLYKEIEEEEKMEAEAMMRKLLDEQLRRDEESKQPTLSPLCASHDLKVIGCYSEEILLVGYARSGLMWTKRNFEKVTSHYKCQKNLPGRKVATTTQATTTQAASTVINPIAEIAFRELLHGNGDDTQVGIVKSFQNFLKKKNQNKLGQQVGSKPITVDKEFDKRRENFENNLLNILNVQMELHNHRESETNTQTTEGFAQNTEDKSDFGISTSESSHIKHVKKVIHKLRSTATLGSTPSTIRVVKNIRSKPNVTTAKEIESGSLEHVQVPRRKVVKIIRDKPQKDLLWENNFETTTNKEDLLTPDKMLETRITNPAGNKMMIEKLSQSKPRKIVKMIKKKDKSSTTTLPLATNVINSMIDQLQQNLVHQRQQQHYEVETEEPKKLEDYPIESKTEQNVNSFIIEEENSIENKAIEDSVSLLEQEESFLEKSSSMDDEDQEPLIRQKRSPVDEEADDLGQGEDAEEDERRWKNKEKRRNQRKKHEKINKEKDKQFIEEVTETTPTTHTSTTNPEYEHEVSLKVRQMTDDLVKEFLTNGTHLFDQKIENFKFLLRSAVRQMMVDAIGILNDDSLVDDSFLEVIRNFIEDQIKVKIKVEKMILASTTITTTTSTTTETTTTIEETTVMMNPEDEMKSGEEIFEVNAIENDQRLRIKTDTLFGNVSLLVTNDILPKEDHLEKAKHTPVILQIRNPFDILVSSQLLLANAAKFNMDEMLHMNDTWHKVIQGQALQWANHAKSWICSNSPDLKVVFYENLVHDFEFELKSLLHFSDIPYEPFQLQHCLMKEIQTPRRSSSSSPDKYFAKLRQKRSIQWSTGFDPTSSYFQLSRDNASQPIRLPTIPYPYDETESRQIEFFICYIDKLLVSKGHPGLPLDLYVHMMDNRYPPNDHIPKHLCDKEAFKHMFFSCDVDI